MKRPVYLDYAATTPVSQEVLQAMLPYFTDQFGNSGSNQHLFGWEAADAVEESRNSIASFFHVKPSSILFTSGATESNNLAILGLLEHQTPGHIISSVLEHKAVLEPLAHLASKGWEITYLKPNLDGEITLEHFIASVKENTRLVSLLWVNNEIGTITDVPAIAQWCSNHSIICHSDATQALGKMAIQHLYLPDLLSFSGHKIFGPKGIGGLYVKPGIGLQARQWGGSQERNLRAGTLAVPLIVGLAKAIQQIPLLLQYLPELEAKKKDLANELKAKLGNSIVINSDSQNQVASILNVSIKGVDWEKLFRSMPLLAMSNGSACNSKSTFPSHVLKALGRPDDMALASLRISLAHPYLQENHEWVKQYLVQHLHQLIHERLDTNFE
ncbi:cysteine desulfurase family protein [Aquirufa rosea]|uniref:cysteine desulfurase family protein n=1 Tax=Aquirufa rosea TaxID=2509241 RepID=UPI0013E93486|nr:cysteine desulfurase family protein [Aquirufa rosea]